ncbi:NUDIX hydrolase [Nocardioides lentus]|uniref:NUDIX hydrolase n=1 Tax=Nocardioides lentus TaxID=338077 RepID=A0ABN2PW18_9ACTN
MTLHADALAVLTAWAAPDAAQEVLRRRYVDHLRLHEDGLTRGCRPSHLTASVLVLDAPAERVLLTLHARAGRWFQLGGHCEPEDATLADAAAREAREESGIADLDLDAVPVQLSEHAVPFCGPAPTSGTTPATTTHHLDVRYLAVAPPGARPVVSDESTDLAWWPADALPEPDADLVELVARARERLVPRRTPSARQP